MSKPSFNKPSVDMKKFRDFKVRISQIPPMDVAFQNMVLTEYELLVATIYKLNELISQTNSYTELINDILEWVLNEGLEQAVLEQLSVWLNDGTLEDLINEALFNGKLDKTEFEEYKLFVTQTLLDLEQSIQSTIDDEISRINVELEDLETNKVDKTYVEGELDNLNDLGISVKYFGAKGDGVTDDTQAFKDAIQYVQTHSNKKALIVPIGEYIINDTLHINDVVTIKGLGGVTSPDNTINKPTLIFQNNGFNLLGDFHLYMSDLLIMGSKKTSNIENSIYGNVGIRMGRGERGLLERVSFNGFDVGMLLKKREEETWGGAYRHFNYCKFRRNTYSVIIEDYVTDTNFLQCDFRGGGTNVIGEGTIIMKTSATGDSYQTAHFIDCMFENMGETGVDRHDKKTAGIQLYGYSKATLIGGYVERVNGYISYYSSISSSAYHHVSGVLFWGEGLIDISKGFAFSETIVTPPLNPDWNEIEEWNTDLNFVSIYNENKEIGYRMVTTNTDPSLSGATHSYQTQSSQVRLGVIPNNLKSLYVTIAFEYKTTSSSLKPFIAGVSSSTTASYNYDEEKHNGWNRKTLTIQLHNREVNNYPFRAIGTEFNVGQEIIMKPPRMIFFGH